LTPIVGSRASRLAVLDVSRLAPAWVSSGGDPKLELLLRGSESVRRRDQVFWRRELDFEQAVVRRILRGIGQREMIPVLGQR
jgi:hypothetical protein